MQNGTGMRAAIYVREPVQAMRNRIDAVKQAEEAAGYCREAGIEIVARYQDEEANGRPSSA